MCKQQPGKRAHTTLVHRKEGDFDGSVVVAQCPPPALAASAAKSLGAPRGGGREHETQEGTVEERLGMGKKNCSVRLPLWWFRLHTSTTTLPAMLLKSMMLKTLPPVLRRAPAVFQATSRRCYSSSSCTCAACTSAVVGVRLSARCHQHVRRSCVALPEGVRCFDRPPP